MVPREQERRNLRSVAAARAEIVRSLRNREGGGEKETTGRESNKGGNKEREGGERMKGGPHNWWLVWSMTYGVQWVRENWY
jgi:hypothetical protein